MAAVTCRVCRTENDPDDEACGHCGSPLPRRRPAAPEPEPTRPQAPSRRPAAPPTPPAPSPQDGGDPFATGVSAALRVPGDRVITLEAGDRLMIGRGRDSPLAALCPDNISRCHAFVGVRDGGVYVADDDSVNGTYLNGSRLEPKREYPVTGHAVIELGSDPPLRIDLEVSEGSQ
jgi:pSer/pThr/pTyr-binding forkhead associated (FHA) protein